MTMDKWSWNCNEREAARNLLGEIKAGEGGSEELWFNDLQRFFPTYSALKVIEDYKWLVAKEKKSERIHAG